MDKIRKNHVQQSKGAYPRLPRVAVGAVVMHEKRFLLVQRGTPPALGQWSIPGGKIRLGETMQEAAEREVLEETGLRIRAKEPLFTFDLIKRDEQDKILFHYIIVDLRAEYLGGEVLAGADAMQARWIGLDELENLDVNPATLALLRDLAGKEQGVSFTAG